MKLLLAVALASSVPSLAFTQAPSKTYWFLFGSEQSAWCGYSNERDFKADAKGQNPTESARVVLSSGKIKEITYQAQPESGDWIVVDKYVFSSNGIVLRRANLLAEENLQVIQRFTINGGNASRFQVESVQTLDGKKANLPENVNYPDLPIWTSQAKFPFTGLVGRLSRAPKVCDK